MAASASTVSLGGSGDTEAGLSAKGAVEFQEADFVGRVQLDKVAEGQWQLSHMETYEQVFLAADHAELVSNPDNGQMAVMAMTGEDAPSDTSFGCRVGT